MGNEENYLKHQEELLSANSVAHDFNNILVASLMNLGLVLQDNRLSVETIARLREMEQELMRGAALSQRLLELKHRARISMGSAAPGAGSAPGVGTRIEGSEMILMVDDEASVRRSTALCLRKLGYAVLEAGNAGEALKIWERNHKRIKLLLTDMMMPASATGLALAEQLRQQDTGLKVIVTSGEPLPSTPTGITHLQKPYKPLGLATIVRQCLDARPL